jgi:hypothetical protein
MTEPLFVCEMIWTAKWLVDWRTSLGATDRRRSNRLLWCIVLILTAAVFTRYDGWIMELIAWTAIGIVLLRRGMLGSRTYWVATLVAIAAPIVWFTYNQVVFGDWLDFARGPYSAAAIELKTSTPGSGPPHPGWHNPWVSLIFYVKVAEMDAAALAWGNFLLIVCTLGTAWGWVMARRKAFAWALILWLPIPFYAYSVSFGSVPIFLPVWWPHSWYNTRYGLEMLPAFAVGIGLAANFIFTAVREFKANWARPVAWALMAIVVVNAAVMIRQYPLVYVEGTKNAAARRPYEREIATALREQLARQPDAPVLMDTSVYPQVVALSGIPLRQTINESDREYFQAALDAPAQRAGMVLTLAGDRIEQAVQAHPQGLRQVGHFTAPGQPAVTLYVSDAPRAQALSGPVAAVVGSGKDRVR